MARFVSTATARVELGNGEWIEARKSIPFIELEPLISQFSDKSATTNIKLAIPFLNMAITGWNLLDDYGQLVPFSKEAILNLDTETVLEVFKRVIEWYFPQKKTSSTSEKLSSSALSESPEGTTPSAIM